MSYRLLENDDGTITLFHESQSFDPAKGSMDSTVHSEITMSAADWAAAAEDLRAMASSSGRGLPFA